MADLEKNSVYIERKIITGMIVSKNYLNRISSIFDVEFLESIEARKIAMWCTEYFHKYGKAPKKHIETIFYNKSKDLEKAQAELIEIILESLSDNYSPNQINIDYLVDESEKYFKKQKLNIELSKIQNEVDNDNLIEAEKLFYDFSAVQQVVSNAVIPLNTIQQIKDAHDTIQNPLINYGDTPIGQMINNAMVRESLVGIIGQNKGGKTFLLFELGLKGAEQGNKVVIFQAGDLSQAQAERRISIYYAKKSDLPKYCQTLFIPTLDCTKNLNGFCDQKIREGGEDALYPFPHFNKSDLRSEFTSKNPVTYEMLIKKYYDFPKHKPCYNCLRFGNAYEFNGTVWYKKRNAVQPLTWKESYKISKKYKSILNNIRLITYPNEGLTIKKINVELDLLEKQGFTSDIVIIDYADILEPDKDTLRDVKRDQENKKWQRARRMSQERKILVIMATQSDAQGFDAPLLSRKNFNEDRRKLDHMTALFGLNMLPREKKKGILRLNNILAREEEGNEIVHVFHKLQIGRPILGSFF